MPMNRRTALLGLTALTAAVPVLGVWPGTARAQDGVEVADMVMGDPDAPVEVIEYASFTCPHCAHFHEDNLPKLKAEYIDTGKVRFIYREVYFDRYGLWAGMLARCGGELRYFGLAELIYAQQKDWAKGGPADIAAALRKIGKTAGMNDEQLDACLSDQAKAEALVAKFETDTAEHGIEATPSFVIDGTTYRNMEWSKLAEIIDERVAAAG